MSGQRVAETKVERTARGARAWAWIARLIFAVLVVAVLAFSFYLASANVALRDELGQAYDELSASRAETSALYGQIRALGEHPVVAPGALDEHPEPFGTFSRQQAAICQPTP